MTLNYRHLGLFFLVLCFSVVSQGQLYAFAPDKGMLLIANEQLTDPRGVSHRPVGSHEIEIGDRRRAAQGVGGVGVAVEERAAAFGGA